MKRNKFTKLLVLCLIGSTTLNSCDLLDDLLSGSLNINLPSNSDLPSEILDYTKDYEYVFDLYQSKGGKHTYKELISIISGGEFNPGTKLHYGSNEPSKMIGGNGDIYVNTSNWNYYTKSKNKWELLGSLYSTINGSEQDSSSVVEPPVPPIYESSPSYPPSIPDVEYDEFEEMPIEQYRDFLLTDLDYILKFVNEHGNLDAQVKENFNVAFHNGVTSIKGSKSVNEALYLYNKTKQEMSDCIECADGYYDYSNVSYEQKEQILGVLEDYAIRNHLTGTTLFENGHYEIFSDRVGLDTENYIPGYGFGLLAEGSINADMENEENVEWRRYYHTWHHEDPHTANYYDDANYYSNEFYKYMQATFFTVFMNETKDGYDWVPELAKEKPIPMDLEYSSTGKSRKWRFEIKTGKDGLKYTTNSAVSDRAAFNNRPVAIEDYETAFKLLLTGQNNYFRGRELAYTRGESGIKGAEEFYNGSTDGFNAELWENVGIKTYEENGRTYFEYEFLQSIDQFYSMYYISSLSVQPIPQEFIDIVTPSDYLGFSNNDIFTPVDNSLSVGPYAFETWESKKHVVYKKNPNYVFANTKYSIPGVHVNILSAATVDQEAGLKEFLVGTTDSAIIPQSRLMEFIHDPRTRKTTGDSNFKLNINSTDAATWEYFFGENGVISQNPKSEYWKVEPALSNDHFVKAISLAINRKDFAENLGYVPSVDYFSSNYLSNPELGISYNNSQIHQDAISQLINNTEKDGYNYELARDYFKAALLELVSEGSYTPGTPGNPTVIELEIAWMTADNIEKYHRYIERYLEDAFNDPYVSNGTFVLDVKHWLGDDWSDVYYDKMMAGKFDIGFGSISSSVYNPLSNMTCLSADPKISSGFTLNWNLDTNDPESDILVYNGLRWSYDALLSAINKDGTLVDNGKRVDAFTVDLISNNQNSNGTWTTVLNLNVSKPELVNINITDIRMSNTDSSNYYEESIIGNCVISNIDSNGVITVTVTSQKDVTAKFGNEVYIDFYVNKTNQSGVTTEDVQSIIFSF